MHLKIENNGPEITSTNFHQSTYAQAGAFYLSINAGAFRLLVPDAQKNAIAEMKTATDIVISFGPWPEQRRDQAAEILFDDNSDNPFAIHIGTEQIDRIPPKAESGRAITFIAYQVAPSGALQEAIRVEGHFRHVSGIPCLKPWKEGA